MGDRNKEEDHRDMEEAGHDVHSLGGNLSRKNFDTDLMDTVRDRALVWDEAIRVLGDGHEIFYLPSDKEGKKKPRPPSMTPMKAIKKLVDVLSLIRWRQEPEDSHLLPLTDEQKHEIVQTLRTLITTMKAYDIVTRDVLTKVNLK